MITLSDCCIIGIVKGRYPKTKRVPVLATPGQEGGMQMGEYTDYGYELDGIEYATVDEAYEDQE